MTTVRGTLLAVALVAGLALAGCGGGKEEELSVAEIVERTTEATAAVKSFHFRFEVEDPATKTSGLNLTFAEGDVIVPGKLRANVAGTLSGIPLRSELVFVAPKQWLKDPFTQAWREYPTNLSPIAFFDPAKGILAVIKNSVDLERAGSATAGGTDSHRLRGKVRVRHVNAFVGGEPSDRFVDVELLVGKEDFLLRRVRLKGPVSPDEPASITRTVAISKFSERVTITAPESG